MYEVLCTVPSTREVLNRHEFPIISKIVYT